MAAIFGALNALIPQAKSLLAVTAEAGIMAKASQKALRPLTEPKMP